VRGLEAVTLCFPPTAGESIVKEKTKKQNGSLRITKYLYGGDAFLIMEDFFSGNGYDIVDKKTFTPNEITLITFGVFVMKICTQKPLE
jgi:hypothetical protein